MVQGGPEAVETAVVAEAKAEEEEVREADLHPVPVLVFQIRSKLQNPQRTVVICIKSTGRMHIIVLNRLAALGAILRILHNNEIASMIVNS